MTPVFRSTSSLAFTTRTAPTAGTGFESRTKLANLEGSKIINTKSFATFKLTHLDQPGFGRADNLADVTASTTLGTHLDISNLDKMGQLSVPLPIAGNVAQNAFVAPFISKYGFICPQDAAARGLSCTPGQPAGGGVVGFGLNARNNDSFGRKGGQAGYNYTLGSKLTHDLHVGYQRYNDFENLNRVSNGWGALTIPSGVGSSIVSPSFKW